MCLCMNFFVHIKGVHPSVQWFSSVSFVLPRTHLSSSFFTISKLKEQIYNHKCKLEWFFVYANEAIERKSEALSNFKRKSENSWRKYSVFGLLVDVLFCGEITVVIFLYWIHFIGFVQWSVWFVNGWSWLFYWNWNWIALNGWIEWNI